MLSMRQVERELQVHVHRDEEGGGPAKADREAARGRSTDITSFMLDSPPSARCLYISMINCICALAMHGTSTIPTFEPSVRRESSDMKSVASTTAMSPRYFRLHSARTIQPSSCRLPYFPRRYYPYPFSMYSCVIPPYRPKTKSRSYTQRSRF